MTYYNVTALADNVTGLDSMVTATNNMTGGAFGMLFLAALWVILCSALYQKSGDMNKAIAVSGFVIFILADISFALGWINGNVIWIILLLMAFPMWFVWKSR